MAVVIMELNIRGPYREETVVSGLTFIHSAVSHAVGFAVASVQLVRTANGGITVPSVSAPAPSPSPSGGGISGGAIAGIIVGVIALLLVAGELALTVTSFAGLVYS